MITQPEYEPTITPEELGVALLRQLLTNEAGQTPRSLLSSPTRTRISMRKRITRIYEHWVNDCGWCGGKWRWATDGRNLFCSHCGH